MRDASLAVIGAGPYGLAVAAHAVERGVDTIVVGRPMAFWRDRMPAGMFLRSGLDWHFDASALYTFAAFAEDRGIRSSDVDPVPLSVFLDYASWFQQRRHVPVHDGHVVALEPIDRGFLLQLEDGSQMVAERVVATPGVGYFASMPDWASDVGPVGAHTFDAVRFDDVAGARVLVVGGRQSAYEWTALLCDHGAEVVEVVHRHPVPAFERVSWEFVDQYMAATVAERGWWRRLPAAEQEAITSRFWGVGRLTLEWWLVPRLPESRVRRRPGTHVTEACLDRSDVARVTLSDNDRLDVDRVLFATGYRVDLARVPYLSGCLERLAVADGYPLLDEAFQSSIPGLYLPGFCATRDFGPFLGFTKACPAAAQLIVEDLVG